MSNTQFEAMRVAHDKHRLAWRITEWSHWSDCDACLAIAEVDLIRATPVSQVVKEKAS